MHCTLYAHEKTSRSRAAEFLACLVYVGHLGIETMTTYGDYTTQVESYGGGDGAKRRDGKGVFPVTIAEIYRSRTTSDDKLLVGENEVADLTIVAMVESVKTTSTRLIFYLNDKSGETIEANYWLDSEHDARNNLPAPNTYIRMFGRIKSFDNHVQLNMFGWKSVNSPDEISFHVLQTVLAHHNMLNPVPLKQQPMQMSAPTQYYGNPSGAPAGRGLGASRFASK